LIAGKEGEKKSPHCCANGEMSHRKGLWIRSEYVLISRRIKKYSLCPIMRMKGFLGNLSVT